MCELLSCSEQQKSGWLCLQGARRCHTSLFSCSQSPPATCPGSCPTTWTNQLRLSTMKQIKHPSLVIHVETARKPLLPGAKVFPIWRPRARLAKGKATDPSPTERHCQAAWGSLQRGCSLESLPSPPGTVLAPDGCWYSQPASSFLGRKESRVITALLFILNVSKKH